MANHQHYSRKSQVSRDFRTMLITEGGDQLAPVAGFLLVRLVSCVVTGRKNKVPGKAGKRAKGNGSKVVFFFFTRTIPAPGNGTNYSTAGEVSTIRDGHIALKSAILPFHSDQSSSPQSHQRHGFSNFYLVL